VDFCIDSELNDYHSALVRRIYNEKYHHFTLPIGTQTLQRNLKWTALLEDFDCFSEEYIDLESNFYSYSRKGSDSKPNNTWNPQKKIYSDIPYDVPEISPSTTTSESKQKPLSPTSPSSSSPSSPSVTPKNGKSDNVLTEQDSDILFKKGWSCSVLPSTRFFEFRSAPSSFSQALR
jgi:hypothetical protein